jgi:hypothetical protein
MNPVTRPLIAFTLTLWLGLAIGAIAQVPAIIQTHLQVKTP